jgi:hypothetical protein
MQYFYHQLIERMDLLIDAVNANLFTWNTFFTALSAISALVASIVALYLSGSYKRIIINLTGHKINEQTFEKTGNQRIYQEITIYNASQRKIRLQDYGYTIGRKKYTSVYYKVRYFLVKPKKIRNPKSTTIVADGSSDNLPFYICAGEECSFGLFPGDYSFNKEKVYKRLYVYVKVNEKIKKYYTGLSLEKYLSLTKNIKDKTPHPNNI